MTTNAFFESRTATSVAIGRRTNKGKGGRWKGDEVEEKRGGKERKDAERSTTG
jgi:hypothetical protein